MADTQTVTYDPTLTPVTGTATSGGQVPTPAEPRAKREGGVVGAVDFSNVYEEGDLPQSRSKYAEAVQSVKAAVSDGLLKHGVYVVIAEFPDDKRSASIQASTMRKKFEGCAFRVITEGGFKKLLCAVEVPE